MSALDMMAGNVVPIYECEFSIGQPVHVIPTTPEEDPEQVWYVVGIEWEYREAIQHGWNITLATADDIKKRYGQTDGYRPQDLLPALTAAGYTIVRKDEVREEALEEAAQMAASFDERTDLLKISGYGVASAIRSLKQRESSNA